MKNIKIFEDYYLDKLVPDNKSLISTKLGELFPYQGLKKFMNKFILYHGGEYIRIILGGNKYDIYSCLFKKESDDSYSYDEMYVNKNNIVGGDVLTSKEFFDKYENEYLDFYEYIRNEKLKFNNIIFIKRKDIRYKNTIKKIYNKLKEVDNLEELLRARYYNL